MQPDSPAYNVSVCLRLQGQIDTVALDCALQQIVTRHEPLRSRFEQAADGLTVVVSPPKQSHPPSRQSSCDENIAPLQFLQLHECAETSDDALSDRVSDEINIPFDLDRSGLLRCVLFSGAVTQTHILVVVVHHLVFDHHSKSRLLEEISALYNYYSHQNESSAADSTEPLHGLITHYENYALEKRQQLQGKQFDRQLRYWRKKLDQQAPPVVPLLSLIHI